MNVKLQLSQDKLKVQYDKAAQQPLCSLFQEDRIQVSNPASGTWTPGIVHVADTPYLVATEKGGTLRRNRRHLRATGEFFSFQVMKRMFHLPTPSRVQPIAESTGLAVHH